VSLFEEFPSYGIISPLVRKYSDKSELWFERGTVDWSVGVGYHAGHKKGDLELSVVIDEENDYVPFCSAFVRGCIFDEVGLLPEDYFLYLEDVAYCIDTSEAGYEICTYRQAEVYHEVSSTIGSHYGPVASYYVARNSIILASRYRSNLPLYFWITHIIWSTSRLLFRVYKFKLPGAYAWIAGIYDGLQMRTGRGRYP
jgi:GT2 family glycosyltransferase